MHADRAAASVFFAMIGIVILVPVVVWWQSVGDPSLYFTRDSPSGQALYAFAKLAGLLGIVLFWVQALLGMAPRVRMFHGIPALSRAAHIRLGLTSVALIATHIGLFVVGSSLRKKTVAWDLLLPNFDHGYYFQSISLGAFALYLLAIALFAGWRLRQGQRRWKSLHMLWSVVFVLALLHSIAIGSESRNSVLVYAFFFIGSSLCFVTAARVIVWVRARERVRQASRHHDPILPDSPSH